MSATIALSSKLPGEPDINGLDSLHDSILANPEQIVVCLVWLDVPSITRNVETGEERPTVRVRRIEPIDTVDKVPAAIIQMASELEEKRTGKRTLGFGQVDSSITDRDDF